jgi:hypothetical protein
MPTVSPSQLPSSRPTSVPTTSSPVAKGVERTSRPTPGPTAQPSISDADLWLAEYNLVLDAMAVVVSAAGDNALSFSRLYVDSAPAASSSSCSDWKTFEYTAAVQIVPYKPAVIQYSWISMAAGRSFRFKNATCDEDEAVAALLNRVTGLSDENVSTSCGDSTWRASQCGSSSQIAMCVDCEDPCVVQLADQCEALLSPCALTAACSDASMIQSLLVWFEERSVIPTISTIVFNASKNCIEISAELSPAEGYLYCAAYAGSTAPSSGSDVVINGFSGTVGGSNVTAVSISGLVPSTEYSVYCVPQSFDGIQASDSVVLSNVWSVTTKCCKRVTASLSSTTVTSGINVLDLLSFYLDSMPSVGLTLDVSLLLVGLTATSLYAAVDQEVVQGLYPSQFVFSKSSGSLEYASLLSSGYGYYEVVVDLQGASAADYEVVFPSGSNLLVVAAGSAVEAPTVSSAVFSSDGSVLAISLSSASNRASLSSPFLCSALFDFVNSGSCVCLWADSATVMAHVAGDGNIIPGDAVTLTTSNPLRAACTSPDASACLSWPTASASSVTATSPSSVLVPTVGVSLPASVSKCGSPIIDLAASSGSGGRIWAQRSIVVHASNGNSSSVQTFIDTVYLVSTVPKAIPASLLQSGVSYTFTVTMCNFMGGCGQGRKTMTVLAGVSPVVSIGGPASRTMYRNTSLSLQGSANVPSCSSSGGSNVGLTYTWSITPSIGTSSTSRDPSALLLSAYSLGSSTLYVVSLSVVYQSTGTVGTTSVKVSVIAGSVVAVVLGGNVRSIRLQSTMAVEASRSFDADVRGVTGTSAGLKFTWSCLQTAPTISSTCAISFSGTEVLTVSASAALAANTTSSLTLHLRDSSLTRSASAVVVVNVVSPVVPVVTITSSIIGKVNPSRSILISGAVELSRQVSGVTIWSSDSSVLSLSSVALTSTSGTLASMSSTQQLLIAGSSLQPNMVYRFYLTATLVTGDSSFASITVSVNSPPSPGSFIVNPLTGEAVTDTFTLYANNWVDSDLPLTYQFGFISPSFGTFMSLQAQSEVNLVSSLLPSGSGTDSSLSCAAQIFDSYNANTSSSRTIQVTAMSITVVEALSKLSDSLSGQLSSVNGMKKMVSLSVAVLSDVTCVNAPNCSALHRSDCSSVSNTCGECLDGYLGSSGVGNTLCVSSAEAVAVLSASGATSCTSGSDVECVVGLYCVELVCVSPSKPCLNDCQSQGTCEFVQISTGDTLSTCSVYDPSCAAQCSCSDDWHGQDCSLSASEIATRQAAIGNVTSQISQISVSENPSSSAISSWLSSVSAVTNDPYDLNEASVSSVQYIADFIIQGAASVGMSVDSVESVLDAIDGTASVVSSATSVGRRYRRRRLSTSGKAFTEDTVNSTLSLLLKYGDYVSSSLVSGQSAASSVKSTFRITSQLADSVSGSISLPTTSLEKVNGAGMSSVQIAVGSSSDSVPLSVMSLSSALYGNAEFNSDPMFLQVSQSACAGTGCEVTVILKNTNPVTYATPMKTTYTTRCSYDDFSVHSYICPDGSSVMAICNGTSAAIHTDCPYKMTVGACNSLNALSGVTNSGCRTVSYNSLNTTCACSLGAATARGRRGLSATDDDDSSSDTTVHVSFVSMASEVAENMKQTWSSAGDLNLSTVEKGWEVIVTIATFAAAVLTALYLAHRADVKAKAVAPLLTDLTKASWTLQSRKGSRKHLDAGHVRDKRASKLKRSHNLEDEQNSIENSLPKILQSKSFSDKFKEEIKRFHRWFGVVFYFSHEFPRVLRIVSLVCSIITMLFIQALTYNFTNPDDGSCEALKTEASCVVPRSVFDSSEPKCYWTDGYRLGSCHFAQPGQSFTVVLFVAIFAAIVSTPVSLMCEWLVLNVLCGKTIKYNSSVIDLDHGMRRPRGRTIEDEDAMAAAKASSLVLPTSLQTDLEELINGIQTYRETLSRVQQKEFDELWGLTDAGKFLSGYQQQHLGPRKWMSAASGGLDVQQMVTEELTKVRSQVCSEFEVFSITNRGHAEKGQRMLFLFQRDLMPGVNGQILESKQKRDNAKPNMRHASTKLFAWLFIILLNLSMLFYIMLFALQQTKQRQSAWFRSFLMWLILEIFLTSTTSVYVTHILIPTIAMRDVGKIKQKLLNTIRDHYASMKKGGNNQPDRSNEDFNAAEHLFVSYRLAKLFPELKESGVILRYSTVWPKQSYLHKADVSQTYSKKFSSIQTAVTMIMIFLITNLLSIPPTFQDMVIHIASTATMGYTILLHLQLFQIYPVLVVVPTLLIGVIAHFLIKGGRAKAKSEIAKLMPVEEKAQRQDVTVKSSRRPVSPGGVKLQLQNGGIAATAGGNSTFKSRRASLKEGSAMVRELMQLGDNDHGAKPVDANVFAAEVRSRSAASSEDKAVDNDDVDHASSGASTHETIADEEHAYRPVETILEFADSDNDSELSAASEDDDAVDDNDVKDDEDDNEESNEESDDEVDIHLPIRAVGFNSYAHSGGGRTSQYSDISSHFIARFLAKQRQRENSTAGVGPDGYSGRADHEQSNSDDNEEHNAS